MIDDGICRDNTRMIYSEDTISGYADYATDFVLITGTNDAISGWEEQMKYKDYEIVEVSHDEELNIIKTRKAKGLFIENTRRCIISNNTTGDAFCEESFKKDNYLAWLTCETVSVGSAIKKYAIITTERLFIVILW